LAESLVTRGIEGRIHKRAANKTSFYQGSSRSVKQPAETIVSCLQQRQQPNRTRSSQLLWWPVYCTCRMVQLETTVWNSSGQHEYLPLNSFQLNSALMLNSVFAIRG